MQDQKLDEKAIFNGALALESSAARQEYLKSACGDDRELFQRVSRLLELQAEAPSFLEIPAVGILATLAMNPPTERVGKTIGRYKLRELLGEGGMGSVYVAEQSEPVRRKVALKIIKPGMDSREVISRFGAERQALALMDHPNIAKVLDAGTTDKGLPYFVMELVKGIPITEHSDLNKLNIRERLNLFLQVCRAVQHAHQKGIIHRDLKPSNVMVMMHDTTPVVKVIDFGVAKAIGQQLTDNTHYTAFSQMVGTPLYMSPEQSGQSGLDVDTRSDVYSLGVLLFELLTGNTPIDRETLKQAGVDEIRRIIREVDPPLPSVQISTLAAEVVSTIAEHHRVEPRKFSQLLRGELDWIVMKALEKDRARRYESAGTFAADVERYLHNEPVQACATSATYRFQKFVRRNKTMLTATVLIAASLLLGTAASLWQALRAEQERVAAVNSRNDMLEQRNKAEQQWQRAEQFARIAEEEAAVALAVNQFINQDLLGSADLNTQPNPNVQVREVLNRAAENVAQRFDGQPLVEAAIRYTLASAYLSLGQYNTAFTHASRCVELRIKLLPTNHESTLKAESLVATIRGKQGFYLEAYQCLQELYEKARVLLPPEHPDLLPIMHDLSRAMQDAGRYAEAESLARQVLNTRREALGPEHADTIASILFLAGVRLDRGYYSEAEDMFRQGLEIGKRVLGPEHPRVLIAMNNLASTYIFRRRYAEAEAMHRNTLDAHKRTFGPEHPNTVSTSCNLAISVKEQGRYIEAEQMIQEELEICRRTLGPEHPLTLGCMISLAGIIESQGHYAEAESRLREVMDIQIRTLGPEHPDTLRCGVGLARTVHLQGHYVEAEAMYREGLELQQRTFGPEHSQTLSSMHDLAVTVCSQGRHVEAEGIFRTVLEVDKRTLGPESLLTINRLHSLGASFLSQGRYAEAEAMIREVLPVYQRTLGPEHPSTITAMYNLALAANYLRRYNEAEAMSREVWELRKRTLGPEHPSTLDSLNLLGLVVTRMGRHADAEAIMREALQVYQRTVGPEHPSTLMCMINLAIAIESQQRYAEAEAMNRQVLEICERTLGQEHPDTLISMNNLSNTIIKQNRNAEAESIFRKTLEIKQRILGAAHPQTLITMFNVIVSLKKQGKYRETIEFARELMDRQRRVLGDDHPATRGTFAYLPKLAWGLATSADPKQRDPNSAVELARGAVEFEPDAASHQSILGVALYRTGAWQHSVECLEKGGDSAHLMFLAMAHWQLEDKDSAKNHYAEGAAWIATYRANDSEQKRFREEAEELLKISEQDRHELIEQYFSQIDTDDAKALTQRGLWNQSQNEHEAAIEDLTAAIDLEPESTTVGRWRSRGISYYKLRQDQNALVDFCKAIELKPNDVYSVTMRAATYFRLEEFDLALVDRCKVIELEPNTNHRYFERAEVYRALGKFELALADINKGFATDAVKDAAWFPRSRAYALRGDIYSDDLRQYEAAVDDFNKAIELEPNNADFLKQREKVYRSLREAAGATDDVEAASRLAAEPAAQL